jgi:hypothetical protein
VRLSRGRVLSLALVASTRAGVDRRRHEDPFHNAAVHYAHEIHAQLHVWPGGHDSGYRHSHLRQYLDFYARRCA